jgi:nitrate/TMAO reductase-like tetraheme cytochrome c subunit
MMRARAWLASVVGVVAAGVGLGAGATWARDPVAGPAVVARPMAAQRNAQCEGCHADIADSWRGSLHRQSFTESDFAAAFGHEPSEFCRSCHAPEADPARGTAIGRLERIGVACVTCHVPRGEHGEGPHDGMRSLVGAGSTACGGCHEFGFPDAPEVAMQSTIREHAQSPAAATSCVDCHMPRRDALGGQRDHAFAASRDLGMLQSAVEIEAERIDDVRVRVRLVPRRIGHAFPTGDMFRRVLVIAQAYEGDNVRAGAVEVIGRSFEGGARRQVDNRLGADGDYGPRDVEIELPGAAGMKVRWSVVYQRTDGAAAVEGEPRVFESVTLGRGEL